MWSPANSCPFAADKSNVKRCELGFKGQGNMTDLIELPVSVFCEREANVATTFSSKLLTLKPEFVSVPLFKSKSNDENKFTLRPIIS